MRTPMTLEGIAEMVNPVVNGWINYYGKYHRSTLRPVLRQLDISLAKWAMRKYKRLRKRKKKAGLFIEGIAKNNPRLFANWRIGMIGVFI